jgi:glutaredoxin/glutathione-dependent peroxiredoxin
MTIQVGDQIPEVVLKRLRDGIESVDTRTLFDARTVVLFAIPGAFTPTCSEKHFPGFVEHFDAFRQRGIEVVCMAVNDPFVMRAWGRSQSAPDALQLLSDGNGDFTRALGLEMDASSSGMGRRSRRFALYAVDGVVQALFVEEPGEFKVSAADYVLQHIPQHAPAPTPQT